MENSQWTLHGKTVSPIWRTDHWTLHSKNVCITRAKSPFDTVWSDDFPRWHECNRPLYEGNMSEPLDIKSGLKQGCVLAPTPFIIFSSMLLKHAFGTSTKEVYFHMHQIRSETFQHRKTESQEQSATGSYSWHAFLLTMMQSLHTLCNNYSVSSIDSLKPANTLDLPSAWKRPSYWGKSWLHLQSSPSTTLNLKWYTSSCTLRPLSVTTCPSTLELRSTLQVY